MKTVGRYKVVTAISPNMWGDYLLFRMSLMRHNSYELFVIGLELLPYQIDFISGQTNTTLIQIKTDDLHIDGEWQKWYKPWFIGQIVDHADLAIWLDADIIVTGPLDPLFERAEMGFFAIQDHFAPQHCHNKSELYAIFSLPQPIDNRVLNSGVIGMMFPRDEIIISRWLENVKLAHRERGIYDNITLHDQGSLLLALQQLNMLNAIVNNKNWNHPAKRLYYSSHVDIIDAVSEDHPNARIIHYAGTPKLSSLQAINLDRNIEYFHKKCGNFIPVKTFIACPDRLAWTIISSMRRGSRAGGWFSLANAPSLAKCIQNKFHDNPVNIDQNLISDHDRVDCPNLYSAGSYWGPLFPELELIWPDAQYIVVLEDLLETIKHKLKYYLIWPKKLMECPGFYQADYGRAVRSNKTLAYRNDHRLVVDESADLVGMCLKEFEWSFHIALQFVADKPNRKVIYNTDLLGIIRSITKGANPRVFDKLWPHIVQSRLPHHPDTDRWIDDFLEPHRQRINDSFLHLMCTHKVLKQSPSAFL